MEHSTPNKTNVAGKLRGRKGQTRLEGAGMGLGEKLPVRKLVFRGADLDITATIEKRPGGRKTHGANQVKRERRTI